MIPARDKRSPIGSRADGMLEDQSRYEVCERIVAVNVYLILDVSIARCARNVPGMNLSHTRITRD